MTEGVLAVLSDRASAAVVRQAIATDLTRRGVHIDTIDDVVLVASELVGNAVVHGGDAATGLDITWRVDHESIEICVQDGSDAQPVPRTADADATNGRGLTIVAALAADWGVRPAGRGKQVWARLPLRRIA